MKRARGIFTCSKTTSSLLLVAGLGAVFVFVSTAPMGLGISPDSAGYLSAASHIAQGEGVTLYSGEPLVDHPPLYPFMLALLCKTTGVSPILAAQLFSAFFMGAVIFCGGLLFVNFMPANRFFALFSTLALVFSVPLFIVSGWAWSDLPFIFFVLMALYFLQSYLIHTEMLPLIQLSVVVALALLTRYIGVTLIVWGSLSLLFLSPRKFKSKLLHLSIFLLVSLLPVGLWLVRNYVLTETVMGLRAPSSFSLMENGITIVEHVMFWYLPRVLTDYMLLLGGVSLGILVLLPVVRKGRLSSLFKRPRQVLSIALFSLVYLGFLLVTSTITAYDRLDHRLLSPLYVPLTLLFLVFIQSLIQSSFRNISKKRLNFLMILGLLFWLGHSLNIVVPATLSRYEMGQGFSKMEWLNSDIIHYVSEHGELLAGGKYYSNAPDALYVRAGFAARHSLAKKRYNSTHIPEDIAEFKGIWPAEEKATLIWVNKMNRVYLYSLEELQEIVHLIPVAQCDDGAIFSMVRK